ncbi:hypothetical protein EIP86_003352 [Pleurotus ostreatoroseus]|nr:hypothetical protein EIP86_003352 [Pleurotus ostreatoroseus]
MDGIFARLPNELVQEVFVHAAAADTQTALALAQVASWVNALVEPLIYDTVVLPTSKAVKSFVATLAHKPAGFAPSRVRHLGVFALGPVDAIDRAIDACRGVESLACGFSLPGYHSVRGSTAVQSLACPREQHLLGLACRDGWDIGLVSPTITHLRIHLSSEQNARLASLSKPDADPDANPGADDFGWGHLASLTALTHLAVVFRPSPSCPATAVLKPIMALLAQTGPAPQSHSQSHPSPPHLDVDHPHPGLERAGAQADPAPRRPTLALVLVQVAGSASSQAAAVAALNAAAAARGGDALRVVAEAAPASAASQWERAVRGGKSVWTDAEAVVCARLAAQEKQKALRAQ